MRFSRIYQNVPFEVGASIELDQRVSHYLLHVLRVKVGHALVLFDGAGRCANVSVTACGRKRLTVLVASCFESSVESPLKIHLHQGVCRGEKMDFVIQKAVELGVAEITPLLTERCQTHLDAKRQASRLVHWEQVMINACEQSGRCHLPTLNAFLNLQDYQGKSISLMLHPGGEKSLNSLSNFTACDLLIGPEGGFSEIELQQLHNKNVSCLRMGPRVLRSETAGLAAIAVLQAAAGDF